MFTGIVEETGKIIKMAPLEGGSLEIRAEKVLKKTKIGDSIAVNGVCLTVTSLGASSFRADVMPETLRRSGLGKLKIGSLVNLERAMAADGRFGGHIVSGHIDGTGVITEKKREENAIWITIKASSEIMDLIVEKGSITIDGISLTVAGVRDDDFSVSIIPHTAGHTTLVEKKAGESVNLENDMLGKYVKRLLGRHSLNQAGILDSSADKGRGSNITMEFLQQNGFF